MTGVIAPDAAESVNEPQLELGDLESLLGFHLRRAHVTMYRDFSNELQELELTQKQCATLQLISANPGVSQVDLAASLDTDRATMLAGIDKLELRGLLVRERSKVDRRRQELRLTDEGHETLSQALLAMKRHDQRFSGKFSDPKLGDLIAMLKSIYDDR